MLKAVADHMFEEHTELLFALDPSKQPVSAMTASPLFLNCRHCDFIAIEPNIMFIHIDMYHGVAGIIDNVANIKVLSDIIFSGTYLQTLLVVNVNFLILCLFLFFSYYISIFKYIIKN